jgi:hypothetical protein
LALLFMQTQQQTWCLIVAKGLETIGEIRRGASIYRYYPAKGSPLDPPALEDPDLESLKKRSAEAAGRHPRDAANASRSPPGLLHTPTAAVALRCSGCGGVRFHACAPG